MLVVKRNGDTEPFAPGRIALAVFRAAQAQKSDSMPATKSRLLGSQVSNLAAVKILEMGANRIEIESIQDVVVDVLMEVGCSDLAATYQEYRSSKNKERGRVGAARKTERGFRFLRADGKSIEVTRDDWANVLTAALLLGAKKEWDVSSWWASVKDSVVDCRNFDEFVGFHIKVLLERSDGREHWLPTAAALLLERWYFRVVGVSPILHGAAESTKAIRLHYKNYWSNRKVVQQAAWFPSSRELDSVGKLIDAKADRSFAFSGLVLLEQDFGFGVSPKLPQEILADSALALIYSQLYAVELVEDRIKDVARLFSLFASCDLIPPMGLMRQAVSAEPCITQESNIPLSDSLESIFGALGRTASSAKSGVAVSVDLGSLRAEGASVGHSGQTSGGVTPVLRLFGEACGMLRGLNGEKQKARLFLPCWHHDVESFLAYSKQAPKELRLGMLMSDAFMKKVFEGGDWVLASPSEAIHLVGSSGSEHEKWSREYAQMAKFGGLGQARSAPAREVFSWICDAISFSGGPSVVFPDACLHYAYPQEQAGLTSRMAGIIPRNRQDVVSTVELGWRCDVDDDDSKLESLLVAHQILARISLRDGGRLMAAVAPVGVIDQGRFAGLLAKAAPRLAKIPGVLPKSSLWQQANPWEARLRLIEQSRGGYLTKIEDSDPILPLCDRRSGPSCVISLSAREEYLWLAGRPPIFVNHENYRTQVRFEGVRTGFGGTGDTESVSKQIKRAASWQKWSDGPLALDIRLGELTSSEVGEAIKTAWLHGLPGIRRFVGQRVEAIS
jgi:hypothetical protein